MHSVTEQQAVGNLDGLQEQLKELTAFVERSAGGRVAAHEVEKGVWNRMLTIGHEALGMFFRLCGDGDEGDRVTLSDGTQVRRLKGLHRQEYTSVFGTFELCRVA